MNQHQREKCAATLRRFRLKLYLIIDVTQEVDFVSQSSHLVLQVSLHQVGRVNVLNTGSFFNTLSNKDITYTDAATVYGGIVANTKLCVKVSPVQ